MLRYLLPLALAGTALSLAEDAPPARDEATPPAQAGGHTFAWPFISWEKMLPRGGTTQGSDVTLQSGPKDSWRALQEDGLSDNERDRLAILALAGSYRVSFDFIETQGFSPDYVPPKPYFSWGTEIVTVLRDDPGFISLQHALVMYFENEGKAEGPFIMKHWRQDWTYEDTSLIQYQGNNSWKKLPAIDSKGTWSQAVYQVDDSPRYETIGEWTHGKNLSSWRSRNSWRPLPRREFSARDDYSVLEGIHEITITPTGWLHVQNNRKLNLTSDSKTYVGTELGFDRYEEISEPKLSEPFAKDWDKVSPYWAAVRDEWAELFSAEDASITLKQKNEAGKKLFSEHFSYAAQLQELPAEDYPSPEELRQHAHETIAAFIAE